MKKRLLTVFFGFALAIMLPAGTAMAHCPLCTLGAGAAALTAASLGLSVLSVGIFLGAFAVAMGLWIGRLLRRKIKIPYLPYWMALLSFMTTILPLQPLLFDNSSFYLSLYGDFGSLLNRTYYVDKFLFGSVVGGIVLFFGPRLSTLLTRLRKSKTFPYQGMILTFLFLILVATFFELLRFFL